MSSPEDYSADLSLWTNAEFTFDIPPGLGIFENDSGFETLSSMNHPAHVLAPETISLPARGPEPKHPVGHNPQSVLDQQHLMEYLNLPNEGKNNLGSDNSDEIDLLDLKDPFSATFFFMLRMSRCHAIRISSLHRSSIFFC